MLNTMINLYNLVNNNTLTETERQEVFEDLRGFVAESARGQRRERIYRTRLEDIPRNTACGIMERLICTPINRGGVKSEVRYVAGQDYPREMALLRNLFDRRGR